MCTLEQLMVLGLHSSCLLSHMDLTGQTEVMIVPALHVCSSLYLPLRHPLTMGRMESCLQTIVNAIWSQTLKRDCPGCVSNVCPLPEMEEAIKRCYTELPNLVCLAENI